MNKKLVFLGGTVGNNDWRERLINELKDTIDTSSLSNPVVKDWNEAAQKAEELAKKNATHFLFYLGDPKQDGLSISGYSLVEATMALYDNPESTVVIFDEDDFSGHSLKAMKQTQKVLRSRFPKANILDSKDEVVKWLVSELKE